MGRLDLPASELSVATVPVDNGLNVRRAPEPRGWPLLGVSWHMRTRPLPFMLQQVHELGDAIRLRLGPYCATLFRNPEHIKQIFVDHADNYSKQTRGYQKSRLVLGQGLVTSEGELWQRQRRIATPAFSRQRVASFAPTMTEATTAMLDAWQDRMRADPSATIDAFEEMMKVTLAIAMRTLLGASSDVGPNAERLRSAITTMLERTNEIITNPFSLPAWVPVPKNVAFNRAIATLDSFVYETIAAKREQLRCDTGVLARTSGPRTGETAVSQENVAQDLLSMLLCARDEQTGEGMNDRQLRDEAVTILIAGHETTANALTWTLCLLSKHPNTRRELRAELDRILNGRVPTVDDLPKLVYTRMVLDESMRLYPPAWMIGRCAKRDDAIGPFSVRAGEFVLISPYVTHRHPALWPNPEGFDPTRFAPDAGPAHALPKFAYLPFGGGQRFCIGATFALMQATLMLATICQRCELDLVGGYEPEPFAMITLRPKPGVPMAARFTD